MTFSIHMLDDVTYVQEQTRTGVILSWFTVNSSQFIIQSSAHTGLEWLGPTTTINRATTTNLSPTSSHCPTFISRV